MPPSVRQRKPPRASPRSQRSGRRGGRPRLTRVAGTATTKRAPFLARPECCRVSLPRRRRAAHDNSAQATSSADRSGDTHRFFEVRNLSAMGALIAQMRVVLVGFTPELGALWKAVLGVRGAPTGNGGEPHGQQSGREPAGTMAGCSEPHARHLVGSVALGPFLC